MLVAHCGYGLKVVLGPYNSWLMAQLEISSTLLVTTNMLLNFFFFFGQMRKLTRGISKLQRKFVISGVFVFLSSLIFALSFKTN